MALPRILLIAGSDSSGGAGIEADQKVVAAHKCYAMTATTALTAQNTISVRKAFPVPPHVVKGQIEASMEDIGADVIKIGMLASVDMISEVARTLKKHEALRTVVDPVMVSTTGAELLPKAAVSCFRKLMIPRATILTPNVPEALQLLEGATEQRPDLNTLKDMVTLAKRVLGLGPAYVLLKGGHLPLTVEGKVARNVEERQMIVNVLCNDKKTYILRMEYQDAKNTHGTGCSLASAIACNLALFQSTVGSEDLMLQAVENACGYVEVGIRTAPNFGKGNGPINHFHGSLIVEKPKDPKDQEVQDSPKSLLQSTLTTEIWNDESIEAPTTYNDKTHDERVLPQAGDLFVKVPSPGITKDMKEALKESEEAEKKAAKKEREEKALSKAAAAVRKTELAAKKEAEKPAKKAEQEAEADAGEVQEPGTKPKRGPTKALVRQPLRLTEKDQSGKRATAAPNGISKRPLGRTEKPAQQQTMTEASEEEGVVEASKDAIKKVPKIVKNRNTGAPIALPSNSVIRSAKTAQQKPAQKARGMKHGREEDSDVEDIDLMEFAGRNVGTTQLAGPSQAPAPKRLKRLPRATEQGTFYAEQDHAAEPSQAPARTGPLRIKLNPPRRAPKKADEGVEVAEVDEYTEAKNKALKKADKEAKKSHKEARKADKEARKKAHKQRMRLLKKTLPLGFQFWASSKAVPWVRNTRARRARRG